MYQILEIPGKLWKEVSSLHQLTVIAKTDIVLDFSADEYNWKQMMESIILKKRVQANTLHTNT